MITIICDWCEKEYLTYKAWIKKYPHHFCSRKCKHEWNKTLTGYWKGKKIPYKKRNKHINGALNPNWRGGRRIDKTGYILIHQPDHPFADGDGYVREHRLVMEKKLGKYLKPREVVHHLNHDTKDNRPENLIIFKNASEHRIFHSKNS